MTTGPRRCLRPNSEAGSPIDYKIIYCGGLVTYADGVRADDDPRVCAANLHYQTVATVFYSTAKVQ